MNNITLLPDYFKYFLQKQNIKHVIIDPNASNASNASDASNINVSTLNIEDSNINDIINNMQVGDVNQLSDVNELSNLTTTP